MGPREVGGGEGTLDTQERKKAVILLIWVFVFLDSVVSMATTQSAYNKPLRPLKAMVKFRSPWCLLVIQCLLRFSCWRICSSGASQVTLCSLQPNFLCKKHLLLCLIGGLPPPEWHWSDLTLEAHCECTLHVDTCVKAWTWKGGTGARAAGGVLLPTQVASEWLEGLAPPWSILSAETDVGLHSGLSPLPCLLTRPSVSQTSHLPCARESQERGSKNHQFTYT